MLWLGATPALLHAQGDADLPDGPMEEDYDEPAPGPRRHNLNGLWMDSGREIRIIHDGSSVTGLFTGEYICDHRNGTGATSTSDLDLHGELVDDELTGDLTTCKWGSSDAGIVPSPLKLRVSPSGLELVGSWFNSVDNRDESLTITRLGCSPRTAADYGLPDNGVSAPYNQPRVYRRAADGNNYYHRTLADGENYVLADGESFRPHGGTDYRSQQSGGGTPAPQPFTTPHAGTVEQASGGYNTIKIRLADGSTLELLHASRIDVTVGQDVTPGTQLGLTGGTARVAPTSSRSTCTFRRTTRAGS
jgi:hypothetical protein